MKTTRLAVLASFLLVLHGVEEYATGFYEIDPLFRKAELLLPFDAHLEFLVYQFIVWGVLAALLYHLRQGRNMRWAIVFLAAILILEVEHIARAFLTRGYYPGLVTASFLPPIGILLFWSLKKTFRSTHGLHT